MNCTSITQYYNTLTYSCENCSTDCYTCFGPRYDQCISCRDPLSLVEGVCSLKCPSGYYRDANSVCKICDLSKCLTCSGSDTNCTGCLYPKVLVADNNGVNGKCDVTCGVEYYYDKLDLSCKSCSSGCISCVDSIKCSRCENTRYLYQDQCVSTCPAGFVGVTTLVDNTCLQCSTNCLKCVYDPVKLQANCIQCLTY